MLEESQFANTSLGRPLRKNEIALIEHLLPSGRFNKKLADQLVSARVEDMHDGGMGSIRFISTLPQKRRMGKVLVEAQYLDEDGVMVSITINGDQNNELYEVDFWKVDFSPLNRYPNPTELKTISPFSA
jgi:hypothetical protein